jgi:hypothetical protein
MRVTTLIAVLSSICIIGCNGHAMWVCPTPRSADSGLKYGPCGGVGDISTAPAITVNPGPMTVMFTETVYHQGSPYRISLSVPGQDTYDQCILLNHIPHKPTSTNMNYAVTINIPDINCPRCALQLIEVMTDKMASQGTPGYTNCTYNPADTASWAGGQCGSNYHSCANIAINGTKSFSSNLCTQPANWTFPSAVSVYKNPENGVYNGMFLNDTKSPVLVETHYSGYCSASIVAAGGPNSTIAGAGYTLGAPTVTVTSAPTAKSALASGIQFLSLMLCLMFVTFGTM